jgi:hypothetical protein
VLWLPTLTLGGDYNRHDGRNQDTQGRVFDNSRSSMMLGAGTGIGPAAVLNVGEALFAPLVARQQLRAREAGLQAASNDTLVAVSDAYFTVQQARGELAGAVEATRRTEELVRRTRKLAPALVPELEVFRAEAELARRQQAELLARERWRLAGAELLRVLRLDPSAQVEPLEPPQLRVELIDLDKPVDDLIPVGLTNRPELASQQAQVQATLAPLRQERLRPLIPSILMRGFSTPVTGTLAAGVFGGGPNGSVGLRGDLDLQVLWQLDNLGFGNRARVHQREAEKRLALLELFRLEDRVAAEVAQAYSQAQLAARRVELAERGPGRPGSRPTRTWSPWARRRGWGTRCCCWSGRRRRWRPCRPWRRPTPITTGQSPTPTGRSSASTGPWGSPPSAWPRASRCRRAPPPPSWRLAARSNRCVSPDRSGFPRATLFARTAPSDPPSPLAQPAGEALVRLLPR